MIVQKSARYGLIIGAISTGIAIFSYALDPSMTIQMILGVISFILIISLWIVFATRVRKENNNSFTYGEAFTSLFTIAIVSMAIGTLWQILLTQAIDPGYSERMLEMSVAMAAKWGAEMTAEQIEEARAGFTLGGQILGFLWSILFMSILTALVALIIKKEGTPFSGNQTPIDAL
jgi:F0F1-type ATP synthase assembly protein I